MNIDANAVKHFLPTSIDKEIRKACLTGYAWSLNFTTEQNMINRSTSYSENKLSG